MAYTDSTLTAGTTVIKKAHINELFTALTSIKSAVKFTTAYNPTLTMADTSRTSVTDITNLRSAINGYETRFSGNCDCLQNTDCCQSCQKQDCQSQCTSVCQSQCTTSCQSCQSCQSQCNKTGTGCQSCQSCQSNSCQYKWKCSGYWDCRSSSSNCDKDCDCSDDYV